MRYEASGQFDALAVPSSPFLSGLYQWRLSLAPAGEERGLKGSDLDVSGFHVVAGRRLRAGPGLTADGRSSAPASLDQLVDDLQRQAPDDAARNV